MKGKFFALLIVTLILMVGCSNGIGESKQGTDEASVSSEPQLPVKLIIEQVDESNFYVVATAEGNQLDYAYYVYKDDKVIHKIGYRKDAHFKYTAKEPGVYKVKVYLKDEEGNTTSKNTNNIEL